MRRDANAIWSVEKQEWELCAVYDNGTCEVCGGSHWMDKNLIRKEAAPGVLWSCPAPTRRAETEATAALRPITLNHSATVG